MNKDEIVRTLRELAQYLEIDGENPFKVRSYLIAADTLEHTPIDIDTLIETQQLRSISGIGEAIEKKIIALYKNEPIPALERVKSKYPASLLELFAIPSLGAKRIRTLFDHLSITNIEQLHQACLQGKVSSLPGFNKKLEEKILQGIEWLQQWKGYFLLSEGFQLANETTEKIKSIPHIQEIHIVGSLRRFAETIRNINLLITTDHPTNVVEQLKTIYPEITQADKKNTFLLSSNPIPILLHITTLENKGSNLVFFTGDKYFVDYIHTHAKNRHWKFNEDGLFKSKNVHVSTNSEEEFFNLLDLPCIPPELREMEYIDTLPVNKISQLVQFGQIQGIVHCHTTYSDGRNTIPELAEYCISNGYKYLVICDHSQSAGYANGLKPEDILEQRKEIEQINTQLYPFRIFQGIESDIKSDGSLDYPDEILAEFDLVIGSIHSKLDMDSVTATKRLIKAIENPHLHVLGHPSGRLLLSRKGYPFDVDAIIEACVEHHVVIEINANPQRLDLDWRNIRKASEKGAEFIISVDAHGIEGISDLYYGVHIARKGTLTQHEVLNCLPAEEFIRCIRSKSPQMT